jgi:hypothetical protein
MPPNGAWFCELVHPRDVIWATGCMVGDAQVNRGAPRFRKWLVSLARVLLHALTIFPRFILLSQAPKGIPLEVIGVAIAVNDASKTLEVDPFAMYYKGKAAF